MATAAGEDTSNSGGGNEDESRPENDGTYECNICLDSAKDAVVSYCGHLFCWPCLHQWLETRPHRQVCPVCKAGISKDKVIPVYGRNATNKQDPRDKMPPRPPGQRPEPENTGGPFNYFGLGEGGFHMSFGIGAFPFGFFASSLNLGDRYYHANQQNLIQTADEQLLSRAFLFIAFIFILWLLVA